MTNIGLSTLNVFLFVGDILLSQESSKLNVSISSAYGLGRGLIFKWKWYLALICYGVFVFVKWDCVLSLRW